MIEKQLIDYFISKYSLILFKTNVDYIILTIEKPCFKNYAFLSLMPYCVRFWNCSVAEDNSILKENMIYVYRNDPKFFEKCDKIITNYKGQGDVLYDVE